MKSLAEARWVRRRTTDGEKHLAVPFRMLQAVVLFAIIAAVWTPRSAKLDALVTADEPEWLTRAANFYYALGQRDLAATYQLEHPGVTALWAGTMGMLWRFPEYRGTGIGQVEVGKFEKTVRDLGREPLELLTAGRLFMVAGTTIALGLGFLYAQRLIGAGPALVAFLLIAFDPFHVALSRLLQPDGLLSSLMLLALLAFLSYLRDRSFRDLAISGAAAGLSWLTKSPGLFLLPVVGLLVAGSWKGFRSPAKDAPPGGSRQVQPPRVFLPALKTLGALASWIAVGAAVFVLLWPAMWVAPLETISKMFHSAFQYAASGHETAIFFNGRIYPDGRLDSPVFYPISYLWRSTPVVLLGLLFSIPAFFLKLKPLDRPSSRRAAAGLVLFALVFLVLQSLGVKKFDRYLLPIYAPLDILAGCGWIAAASGLSGRRPVDRIQKAGSLLLLGVAILVQGMGTLQTFPYYLSYYNPLLGGNRRAPEVMMVGWGEGLDAAARYLNEKANPERLKVTSWYRVVLSYYFKGEIRNIPLQSGLDGDQLDRLVDADYAVIYLHQWQRQMPRPLLDTLAGQTPEHTVKVDGLEYAKIYRLKPVP